MSSLQSHPTDPPSLQRNQQSTNGGHHSAIPLDPLSEDGARTIYWRKRNEAVLGAARKLEISNLRYRHGSTSSGR